MREKPNGVSRMGAQPDPKIARQARRAAARDSAIAALEEHIPSERRGWRLRFLENKAPARGARVIFFAEGRSSRTRLAVKVYAKPNAAVRTFRAAMRVQARGAPIAEPIACDPDRGVFAARWIGEGTLDQKLGGADHDRTIALAALWYTQFLCHARLEGQDWSGTHIQERLTTLRRSIATADAEPELETAAERVEAQLRHSVGTRFHLADLHGDFCTRNLCKAPRGVRGIDLTGETRGPIELDIARFLQQLHRDRVRPAHPLSGYDGAVGLDGNRFITIVDRLVPVNRALVGALFDLLVTQSALQDLRRTLSPSLAELSRSEVARVAAGGACPALA
ncbi:MAG: hypothetical protein ACU0CI_08110 [Shimia sp.]